MKKGEPHGMILSLTKLPTYGIYRIDQDYKKNYGWFVRLKNKGQKVSKWFADKKNGGKRKALQAAKVYRDEQLALLLK